MGRALAIALVLTVAALAHVSAQSPQTAKPFLATQYATVRPGLSCFSLLITPAWQQLVLVTDPWVEPCGLVGGGVYAMELAWRRVDGDPCTSKLGHSNL